MASSRGIPESVLIGLALVTGCPTESTPAADAESTSSGSEGPSTTVDPTPATTTIDTSGASESSTGDGSASGSSDGGTGGASSETSGSTDASATGSSSSGSSSTGDTDTDTDTDGETGVVPGGCAADCTVGCTSDLLLGLAGGVTVAHDGTTILGRDEGGRAGLWRASDRQLVHAASGVDAAVLAGGIAGLQIAGEVEIRAAADGSLLGSFTVDDSWGIAPGGSYLWSAGAAGISRIDSDGSLAWTLPGAFSAAVVLALPDAVHVFTPADPDELHHVDAGTGVDATTIIDGELGGWFGDSPRAWTTEGDAYRVYDSDGTELAFALGVPVYGWGDRLLLRDDFGLMIDIVDVADTDTVLATLGDPQWSGAGLLGSDAGFSAIVLVDLDDPLLAQQPVTPGCCVYTFGTDPWTFAYQDGAWAVGGAAGQLFDHLAEPVTPGELLHTYGASAGRIAAATSLDRTHVFDVDPECTTTGAGSFARPSTAAVLADDGVVLMTPEHPWLDGVYFGQTYLRFYDTNLGTMTVEDGPLLTNMGWIGGQLSDAGGLFSASFNTDGTFMTNIATQPALDSWDAGNYSVIPSVSPDGNHAVRCDAGTGIFETLEDAQSYVLDEDGLVALVDGVAWGFLSDDELLVGHYVADDDGVGTCWTPWECSAFVSSEIVDLDGEPIAATSLPETRAFERVGAHEIFAADSFTIWDVDGGVALWDAPAGTVAAAPVGTDFVVLTDGAVLRLVKWR